MAEYIDRNRLIKKFCNHCYFDVGEKNCAEDCYDMKIIKSLPIEDVQPVKHGEWMPSEDDSKVFGCSKCHEIVYGTPNYCPRCGARMDDET